MVVSDPFVCSNYSKNLKIVHCWARQNLPRWLLSDWNQEETYIRYCFPVLTFGFSVCLPCLTNKCTLLVTICYSLGWLFLCILLTMRGVKRGPWTVLSWIFLNLHSDISSKSEIDEFALVINSPSEVVRALKEHILTLVDLQCTYCLPPLHSSSVHGEIVTCNI